MRKYLCNLRTYYVNFRATSLKYCYLHVLNFYLVDNGVMTTPKRRFLSFAFTVLSFKKSLLIRNLEIVCTLCFSKIAPWAHAISILSEKPICANYFQIELEVV